MPKLAKPSIDTKRSAPSHNSNQANPKPINSPQQARDGSRRGK